MNNKSQGNNNADDEISTNVSVTECGNIARESITGAPKRMRESSQCSFLFDNVMKTPRLSSNDSPFKLLNLVDKRFESLQNLLKTMFQESEARLEKMFDAKLNDLLKDMQSINERVTKLETVVDEVKNLKGEVQTLKSQLQRQENSLIASDLRINGIPYHKEEDLLSVFNDICNTLQINTPMVKSIYRLQNQNNRVKGFSPDAVIIVKLYSPYDKNFILKTLTQFRQVNKTNFLLNHIGYGSNAPFYVNENLTSSNHKILLSTLKLKKSKHIFTTFTNRDLVYLKMVPPNKCENKNSESKTAKK